MMAATVVPELIQLDQDLKLVRDLPGHLGTLRRAYFDVYGQSTSDTVHALDDTELVAYVVTGLGHIEWLLEECRRRGMLG